MLWASHSVTRGRIVADGVGFLPESSEVGVPRLLRGFSGETVALPSSATEPPPCSRTAEIPHPDA